MTKKTSSEGKNERDAKGATKKAAEKNASVVSPGVTIETSIRDIEIQFDNYIKNVGAGALNDIMNEVRKSERAGRYEDKIDGQIVLRLAKEGLKLVLTAKTQVVVKEVHKDEFTAISADPKQPELPGIKEDATKKKETITGGGVAEADDELPSEDTGDGFDDDGGIDPEN